MQKPSRASFARSDKVRASAADFAALRWKVDAVQPIWISLVACMVMLLGALTGIVLRRVLPDDHLDAHAKDIVRLGAGLVGTIAALVLGLLINSASSGFEAQRSEVRQIATDVILLDDLLQQYGPETKPVRLLLREAVNEMVERIWHDLDSRRAAVTYNVGTIGAKVYADIHALPAETTVKKALVTQALQMAIPISQARLMLYERSKSSLPKPILVVLLFWLTVLFASYCLFSPVNPTSAVALVLVALSASAALFLILEMGEPFSGFMQISSLSIRTALPPLAP